VQFVESIPLGATGKMLKTELRETFTGLPLAHRLRAGIIAGAPPQWTRSRTTRQETHHGYPYRGAFALAAAFAPRATAVRARRAP
jgi:hypothetical protein